MQLSQDTHASAAAPSPDQMKTKHVKASLMKLMVLPPRYGRWHPELFTMLPRSDLRCLMTIAALKRKVGALLHILKGESLRIFLSLLD